MIMAGQKSGITGGNIKAKTELFERRLRPEEEFTIQNFRQISLRTRGSPGGSVV